MGKYKTILTLVVVVVVLVLREKQKTKRVSILFNLGNSPSTHLELGQ